MSAKLMKLSQLFAGQIRSSGELRADSRTFAPKMDIRHHQLMDNIRKYQSKFEELGLLPFEKEARPEGGMAVAMLFTHCLTKIKLTFS